MGFSIEDGTGSSRQAGVNTDNRLMISGIASSIEHHINHEHGMAYHAIFSQSPTAGDDCIFYMSNDADEDIVVEGIILAVSAACEVYVKLNSAGTRNSASAITPVNCNAGSGLTATATVEQGADLDGGAATLANGDEVIRWVFNGAKDSSDMNFPQDIILPKNKTLTIWCSSATPTVDGVIPFNYHAGDLG